MLPWTTVVSLEQFCGQVCMRRHGLKGTCFTQSQPMSNPAQPCLFLHQNKLLSLFFSELKEGDTILELREGELGEELSPRMTNSF